MQLNALNDSYLCLAHLMDEPEQLSFAMGLDWNQAGSNLQKLYIGITQTEGSGGAGLVTFFKDRSSLTNAASSYSDVHVNPSNNLLARLAPVIPKVNSLL